MLMSPARWISGVGRLAGLSIPARVMLVLAIFLVVVAVGYYVILWNQTDRTYFWDRLTLRFLVPLTVCLVALPVTAYYATRFWLETPPSEFPDIDESWKLGLEAVARAGIDITEVPMYFTVGVSEAKLADQVMQSSSWELIVDGLPNGSHPLRWYASKRAVMLFLLDASATSKLHAPPDESQTQAPTDLRGTMVGSPTESPAPAAADPSAAARGLRGTIVASSDAGKAEAPSAPRAMSLKGTMIAGAGESTSAGTAISAAQASTRSPQLDRQERILQGQRLERVCELASSTRLPLCPLNGILGVVDWSLLLASRDGQLAAAVRADYDAIVKAAKVYVPMILLINGLDSDPGFVELARRVGEDRAKNNRFGHGHSHLIPPGHDQMLALASHAAGQFEDWIYDLFKHPDCLDRSNNERLFSLLCRTRNELNPRLSELLVGLATAGNSERGMMLAGCYFGATGKNQVRQAFVRSVVEKLVDLEDDIEWTESALAAENRLQGLLRLIVFLNALIIVFIGCVVGFRFFFR